MTDQLTLTVDPLADAIAWREKNPAAWAALVQWATEDVSAGVRPSMDAYGHILRRPHMAERLGLQRSVDSPVLFNNNLTSSLARLLVREYGFAFDTRSARVDSWAS